MARVEYFLTDDGDMLRLGDGGRRKTVRPSEVAQAWLGVTRVIPPQFAVGSALHESNFTLNEYDVEDGGTETYGLFQLSRDDKWLRARMPEADFYTLDGQVRIFSAVCEGYLADLFDGIDAWNEANGLPPVSRANPPSDIWAYLAIAHNQGIGRIGGSKGALGTIGRYGLDWERYKRNNPTVNIAMVRDGAIYGDDAITGGAAWEDAYALPFDDSGDEIPAPTVSALASSRLRLALLTLLLLLVAYAVATRGPWKGSVT